MAGLGAMVIGMITGGIMMAVIAVVTVIYAIIIYFDARRHNMKAVLWAVMALIFNLYSLPVYIFVRIKIANLRCTACGIKVGEGKNFCPECGAEIKKVDDGTIAKKVIIGVLIAWAIISILGGIYTAVVSNINP
ncbi:MAG: zinc ribbon domain-containing protein [Acutalibacteraceae bacterium]|nr:zinc ribbon domain-containing protein [Acutalibacteraceae bacterium]